MNTLEQALHAARALVLADLVAGEVAEAEVVSLVEDAVAHRRWWVEQWPEGVAFVAGLVAQDVQDALLERYGRWPLCPVCTDGRPARAGRRAGAGARPALGLRQGAVSVARWALGGRARPVTVYIDPPTWPGHGRMWSHLVSDVSFEELHAFAAAHRLPATRLRARPLRRAPRRATRTRCAPGAVEVGSKETGAPAHGRGAAAAEGAVGLAPATSPGWASGVCLGAVGRRAEDVRDAPLAVRGAGAATPPPRRWPTQQSSPRPPRPWPGSRSRASMTVPPSQGPPVLPRLNAAVVVAPARVGAAPATLNIRALSAGAV